MNNAIAQEQGPLEALERNIRGMLAAERPSVSNEDLLGQIEGIIEQAGFSILGENLMLEGRNRCVVTVVDGSGMPSDLDVVWEIHGDERCSGDGDPYEHHGMFGGEEGGDHDWQVSKGDRTTKPHPESKPTL